MTKTPIEPIGYLWIMEDDTKQVMWEPVSDDDALYSAPIKGYKDFKKIYGPAAYNRSRQLETEVAELVKTLEEIVALDDGNTPDLWHFEAEFNSARALLAKHKERT